MNLAEAETGKNKEKNTLPAPIPEPLSVAMPNCTVLRSESDLAFDCINQIKRTIMSRMRVEAKGSTYAKLLANGSKCRSFFLDVELLDLDGDDSWVRLP